jgi:Domain of unknown function (DUF6268)
MFRNRWHAVVTLGLVLSVAWSLRANAQAPETAVPASGQTSPTPPPVKADDLPLPPMLPPPPPPPPPNTVRPNADPFYTQGPFANLFSPTVGEMQLRADYRAFWFPDETVSGQGTKLGYVEESFSAAIPLWQDSTDEFSGSAGVRNEVFHTDGTILPNSKMPFPDDLWNIRLGLGYRHLFDNGWIAGGNVSVGSASDVPFNNLNDMFVSGSAFLRVPEAERNAWLFSISYSPLGEITFPIPGVAFLWRPSDSFQMNIGLPFALVYRPTEDLTFDFSYMLLRSVHARTLYRLSPRVRMYAGFDWSNESYFLADRLDVNNRFYYYDMTVSGGVQFPVVRQLLMDVSAGYVFSRYYFQNHNSNDSNYDRVDVGAGPVLGLRAGMRF